RSRPPRPRCGRRGQRHLRPRARRHRPGRPPLRAALPVGAPHPPRPPPRGGRGDRRRHAGPPHAGGVAPGVRRRGGWLRAALRPTPDTRRPPAGGAAVTGIMALGRHTGPFLDLPVHVVSVDPADVLTDLSAMYDLLRAQLSTGGAAVVIY